MINVGEDKKASFIIAKFNRLAQDRAAWDEVWEDIATFYLPQGKRFTAGAYSDTSAQRSLNDRPMSRERGGKRVDSQAIVALENLTSRIYALTMPSGTNYQTATAPYLARSGRQVVEDKQWLDELTNCIMDYRYQEGAGFVTASQKSVRSMCAYGTGIYTTMSGDSFEDPNLRHLVTAYQFCPLQDNFLDIDALGNHDTLLTRMRMTIKQFIQKFGEDALTQRMKDIRARQNGDSEMVTIIRAIIPKAGLPKEKDGARFTLPGSKESWPWACCYVALEDKKVVEESSFMSFPVTVYTWGMSDDGIYGESPAMAALDDVRGKNMLKRLAYRSIQQAVDPAFALADDAITGRINLNNRAMNPGLLGPDGSMRIKPIHLGGDPQQIQAILDAEAKLIDRLMFVEFFALLDQKLMAAKAADIYRLEMAQAQIMLPIGDRIALGNARTFQREIEIVNRMGFEDMLPRTENLKGEKIKIISSGPLDKLRKMPDAMAIGAFFENTQGIAAINPEAYKERIDTDVAMEVVRDAIGAPAKIFRPDEVVQRERLAKQKAQAKQAQMEMVGQAAAAAKDAVPAVQQIQEGGIPPELAGLFGGGQQQRPPEPA